MEVRKNQIIGSETKFRITELFLTVTTNNSAQKKNYKVMHNQNLHRD